MVWKALPNEETDISAVPVSRSLDIICERLGIAPPNDLTKVFNAWESLAGPDIAKHAEPVSLVDGVLTLRITDARWLPHLKWLGPQLGERINSELSSAVVKRVEPRLKNS